MATLTRSTTVRTLPPAALALAAGLALLAVVPLASAQQGDPGEVPPAAAALCTPERGGDPLPAVVARPIDLYYGTVIDEKGRAYDAVDTTALLPRVLGDAIANTVPDPRIASNIARRVNATADPVAWVQDDPPAENAYGNWVRFVGAMPPQGSTLVMENPVKRSTLYFKVASWTTGGGGIVVEEQDHCGVAAVTFFVVAGRVTGPGGNDDTGPSLFPPTPTPTLTPPFAVFDPPNDDSALPQFVPPTLTPTRAPASTPTRQPSAVVASATPSTGGSAGAPVLGAPPSLPTPRPPDAGSGGQPGSDAGLLVAAVALIAVSGGLMAGGRKAR